MGLLDALFGRGGGKPRQSVVRLAGPSFCTFDVVGESFHQDALENVCGGRCYDGVAHHCDALLELEEHNPYDANAVAVRIDGRTVAYLSRGDAADFRARVAELGLSARSFVCGAVVLGGWDRGRHDRGEFGVKLGLTWPVEVEAGPLPALTRGARQPGPCSCGLAKA